MTAAALKNYCFQAARTGIRTYRDELATRSDIVAKGRRLTIVIDELGRRIEAKRASSDVSGSEAILRQLIIIRSLLREKYRSTTM